MKCIVIDDEPFASDLIKSYVEKTQLLELQGVFANPLKALTFLMQNKTDLIFLDINMPELNGLQFLKSLNHIPAVVFTTAYSEYGAESYNFDAVDYLLKPIKYERFLKSVNKAYELYIRNTNNNSDKFQSKTTNENFKVDKSYLLLKSGSKVYKINPDSILFVEATGNYMTFHTTDDKILSLLTMKELMIQLPADSFIRVHKSFVVSISKIDVIERNRLTIGNHKIPIGSTYREQCLSTISGKTKNKSD